MNIKSLVEELKEIMGSNQYDQKTQHARAVADFIFAIEDQKTQKVLFRFLLKNQGNGNIPETFQYSLVPKMSNERFDSILEKIGNDTDDFLRGILSDKLSIKKAADRIFDRFKKIDDKDEQDFFLAQVLYGGLCPYCWKFSSQPISEEDWQEAKNKLIELEIYERIIHLFDNRKTRFVRKSDEGQEYLELMKDLTDLERIAFLYILVSHAKHNPCECIQKEMDLSPILSALDRIPGVVGVHITSTDI